MELVYQLDALQNAAAWLIRQSADRRCFAFHGEMGAGKTTLISIICECLGVESGQSSPTFSIINEYLSQQNQSIYHIDLYRLKNASEAVQAGVEDVLFSGDYCFVEWPERAESLFPADTVHCYLSLEGPESRKLKIIL